MIRRSSFLFDDFGGWLHTWRQSMSRPGCELRPGQRRLQVRSYSDDEEVGAAGNRSSIADRSENDFLPRVVVAHADVGAYEFKFKTSKGLGNGIPDPVLRGGASVRSFPEGIDEINQLRRFETERHLPSLAISHCDSKHCHRSVPS